MADYVVDLGPGAGEHGGQVIFQGNTRATAERPHVGDRSVICAASGPQDYAGVRDARPRRGRSWSPRRPGPQHEERGLAFPLGLFTAGTGVSGSASRP